MGEGWRGTAKSTGRGIASEGASRISLARLFLLSWTSSATRPVLSSSVRAAAAPALSAAVPYTDLVTNAVQSCAGHSRPAFFLSAGLVVAPLRVHPARHACISLPVGLSRCSRRSQPNVTRGCRHSTPARTTTHTSRNILRMKKCRKLHARIVCGSVCTGGRRASSPVCAARLLVGCMRDGGGSLCARSTARRSSPREQAHEIPQLHERVEGERASQLPVHADPAPRMSLDGSHSGRAE